MSNVCASGHTSHIYLHILLAHTLSGLNLKACLMTLTHKVVLATLLMWFHDTVLLRISSQIDN